MITNIKDRKMSQENLLTKEINVRGKKGRTISFAWSHLYIRSLFSSPFTNQKLENVLPYTYFIAL